MLLPAAAAPRVELEQCAVSTARCRKRERCLPNAYEFPSSIFKNTFRSFFGDLFQIFFRAYGTITRFEIGITPAVTGLFSAGFSVTLFRLMAAVR